MENIVKYESEDKIGNILLNNPEKDNSLDLRTLEILIEAFQKSAANNDMIVLYKAKGENFTVGADLKYAYDLSNEKEKLDEAMKFLESWQILTRKILQHPGIIIVGLHGWVIGGGFEHTLACDIRIAADNTKIMLPELNAGLIFSNASTKLLPRIIGEGRAKYYMLLGKEIDAEEALKFGLISEIYKKSSLDKKLNLTAEKLTQMSHLALKRAKILIQENRDNSIEETLRNELIAMKETAQSEELKRRLSLFVKKGH